MTETERHYARRLKRHTVHGVIEVYDSNRDLYIGRLVNVHGEGLMLMGDVLLESDCVYQLDLQLPTPLRGDKVIRLGVDCLWVRSSEESTTNWSGFHIIDLSDQAREQITDLMMQMT